MITPSQIERLRQQRASLTNSANQLAQAQSISSNLIQSGIPNNLKLKGQAALGKRVLDFLLEYSPNHDIQYIHLHPK